MSTRATLSGIFASVSILVVGWQAGAAVVSPQPSTTGTSTTSSAATSTTSTTSGTSSAASPSTSATKKAPKDGTFNGDSVQTPFGNMQVQIVVAGGKITDVKALQVTDYGGRSVQISNYATPILRSEVLKSQSAQVSTVGGGTYTSEGYLNSVQSAIDKAGL